MIDNSGDPTDAVKRRVGSLLGASLSSRWNDDQQLAWAGLMEVSRVLAAEHDREMMARHGLSLTLLSLLGRLSECDEAVSQARDLAADLNLSPSRVSRHLATLESAGLVSRSHDAEDGRALDVELTDAGRARLAAARETAVEIVERDFLGRFTAGEIADLARFATKLLQARPAMGD